MTYKIWLTGITVCLLMTACKPGEEILIPNNVPPVDETVSLVYRENFVSKTYLGLLGRQANENEMTTAMALLDRNNCSVADRKELLDSLMSDIQYRRFHFNKDYNELLGYPDSYFVNQWLPDYIQEQIDAPQNDDDIVWQGYLTAQDTLKELWTNYNNGYFDLRDCHFRMTHNLVYYWNIGSIGEWPKETFLYFLHRYPTIQEDYDCFNMMSGLSTSVFGQSGDSFEDLRLIFFNSSEYFEGQTRILFSRYLDREPSHEELLEYVGVYQNTLNIKTLQQKILLTDEFLFN